MLDGRSFYVNVVVAFALVSVVSCAHIPAISSPQVQMARQIIEAPEGIDVSFDGQSCHVADWTAAWILLGERLHAKTSKEKPACPVQQLKRNPASDTGMKY